MAGVPASGCVGLGVCGGMDGGGRGLSPNLGFEGMAAGGARCGLCLSWGTRLFHRLFSKTRCFCFICFFFFLLF